MWFERTVPAPERLPDVPMRLGDCIRGFLSGTTRIDVHIRVGKGWQKVNALRFAEGDDAEDPEQIAALVKACAEHHAAEAHAAGKYRAMVWRYFGGELERRKAAFAVELTRPERRPPPTPRRTPPRPRRSRRDQRPRTLDITRMLDALVSPDRRPAPPPRPSRRDQWRKALETKLVLDELLAQPGGVPFDPFADLRSIMETPLARIRRELAEMSAIFEAGERTGTAEGMGLAEMDIRWKLALLRGQEDGEIWTELAPTIESGFAKLREEALAKRTTSTELEPPSSAAAHAAAPNAGQADAPSPEHETASELNAEREEGASPLPDDAPSSGMVRSGA